MLTQYFLSQDGGKCFPNPGSPTFCHDCHATRARLDHLKNAFLVTGGGGGLVVQKLFLIDLNFRKKAAPCVEPKPDVNCDYSCQNGFCMVMPYHSKLEFHLLFEFRN